MAVIIAAPYMSVMFMIASALDSAIAGMRMVVSLVRTVTMNAITLFIFAPSKLVKTGEQYQMIFFTSISFGNVVCVFGLLRFALLFYF